MVMDLDVVQGNRSMEVASISSETSCHVSQFRGILLKAASFLHIRGSLTTLDGVPSDSTPGSLMVHKHFFSR